MKHKLLATSLALNVILAVTVAPIVGALLVEQTSLDGTYQGVVLGAMPTPQGTVPALTETVKVSGRLVRVESKMGSEVTSVVQGQIVERTGSTVRIAYEGPRRAELLHLPTKWPWDRAAANARTYQRAG